MRHRIYDPYKKYRVTTVEYSLDGGVTWHMLGMTDGSTASLYKEIDTKHDGLVRSRNEEDKIVFQRLTKKAQRRLNEAK